MITDKEITGISDSDWIKPSVLYIDESNSIPNAVMIMVEQDNPHDLYDVAIIQLDGDGLDKLITTLIKTRAELASAVVMDSQK